MKLKKLNVMKNRPEVSDEEIRSMMDFDKVLKQHNNGKKLKYVSAIVGGCVVIALVGLWWLFKPVETTEKVTPIETPEVKEQVVVPEQRKEEEKEIKKETQVLPQPAVTRKTEQTKPRPQDITDNHYEEATPVNGYDNLYAYFEKELKYPAGQTAQGEVTVSFVITHLSMIEQIQFENSLGPEFDKEVIRVLNNMPGWRPATKNGRPIDARISQTFTFSVDH